MFIKVKAVAREIKSGQKGFFRGVKREQGWLNVWSKDEAPLKLIRTGGTIDVTEPETYDTGRGQAWSCWLSVKQEQPQSKAEEPEPQPVQAPPPRKCDSGRMWTQ